MSAEIDKAIEEVTALEVRCREHVTEKNVFGKVVKKSFGQDFVDLLGDDGKWRHIGYYSHTARFFSGLVNWDNSLNDDVCKALEKIKGHPVRHSLAPQDEPEQSEDDDDEFEGED